MPDQQPPKQSVHSRTLLQSWRAIPAKTRLFISFQVVLFGSAGIVVSEYLEKKLPAVKNDIEEKK